MTDPFVDPNELSGGAYFKVQDALTAVAVMFEPKSIRRDVPGRFGEKDEVVADVTVFGTQDSLTRGVPTEVSRSAVISSGSIVRALDRLMSAGGTVTVARISKEPNSSGAGIRYQLNKLGGDDQRKAVEYYNNREQQFAAAAASAPGFD